MSEAVIGRETEMTKVVSAVKKSQKVFLYGIDGIGKTTVLSEAMKRLPKNTVAAYFSFSMLDTLTADEFLERFGKSLLGAYEERLGLGDIDELYGLSIVDLDIHLKNCRLSNTVKEKLKVSVASGQQKKKDHKGCLAALLQLADLLAAETGTRCAIMFDDIQVVSGIREGLDSSGIMGAVENSFSLHSHTSLVMAGTRMPAGFSSDFLVGIERIGLSPLTKTEAGKDYDYHLGIPLYMRLGKGAMQAIGLLFSERLNRLSTKERIILFTMAKASVNTPSTIAKEIDYSQTSVRRFLTIMEEKGFVSLKARGRFEIDDPVFERWLKER
ncbi:TPA: ATP-binding protein [Candidatus Woesearchaeota archaeon]|nr:ATP-binding protein [Candidatus Woesearchaeota archaeon]